MSRCLDHCARTAAAVRLRDRCSKNGRSDFRETPPIIDVAATLAGMRTSDSPLQGVSHAKYRGILRAIVAGGLPTPDRLKHTTGCDQSGDAVYLFWHDARFDQVRARYQNDLRKLRAWAWHHPGADEANTEVVNHSTFRATGVVSTPSADIHFASQRASLETDSRD